MKVVIPGGSGQVGQALARAYASDGHEVVILSRGRAVAAGRAVSWDGRSLGPWAEELDGDHLVVNLAGRSVNCRYTGANLQAMIDSRVDSTRVVGEAVTRAVRPPGVWMQMSTATIYAHRFDAPNDEATGLIASEEPGVPGYWAYSVQIARKWEQALADAPTPVTRTVALRTAMVMSPDRGGVFDVLLSPNPPIHDDALAPRHTISRPNFCGPQLRTLRVRAFRSSAPDHDLAHLARKYGQPAAFSRPRGVSGRRRRDWTPIRSPQIGGSGLRLTRLGLGGPAAGGRQFVS